MYFKAREEEVILLKKTLDRRKSALPEMRKRIS